MKAIRKDFNSEYLFPIQMVYKDTKLPQKELPNHFHEWYEIVYVYSGKGTFFIDHTFQDMGQGDIFFLPGNTIHHAIPDNELPVTSTALFFDPLLLHNRFSDSTFSYLQLFDESARLQQYRYSLSPEQRNQVNLFLDYIYKELISDRNEVDYKQATLLQLQMMLLQLNRSIIQQQEKQSTRKAIPSWLNDVLGYIEEHYTSELSLNSLSEYGNVSPAHFSRVFKQKTGLNISEYITTKRILLAKNLLLQTNLNVSLIAEKCAFESMPHFYRTFKKYIGVTPSEYRKQGYLSQSH
ncbi:AraC family transcriptional regulator [Domibacillus indicus]|uniref:AraC family transcriptional regulator n=1 Tax=Domibacillus indicus TaxID=1437523 RepID=UPI00203D2889|nr:AraC family transcriptional regulator [Domibacillus indicus]MCM3790538.1 AraC family transcriptional regulator [Domibacillus indicus]